MQRFGMSSRKIALAAALALASLGPGVAWAQHSHEHGKSEEAEGHSHAKAMAHGGEVTMTQEFHFEVAFRDDGVDVWGYDAHQQPIDLEGVQGRIRVQFRDAKRAPVEAELHYVPASKAAATRHEHGEGEGMHGGSMHEGMHGGATVGHLAADLDLARVTEGDAKASITLQGLPGKKEKKVQFKTAYRLARQMTYMCPMKDSEPSMTAGSCPKCGMMREAVRFVYACPKHPEVTSMHPGKCWKDGTALEPRYEDGDGDAAGGMGMGGHDHSH